MRRLYGFNIRSLSFKKILSLNNKPNSTRNPISLKLNLNYSSNINANKKENEIKSNKTTKSILIFKIEKIPKATINSLNQNNSHISSQSNMNFKFSNDKEIVSYAGDYLEEIYLNLLIEENHSIIKPKMGYMNKQTEINEQMRAILVDWIIEVHFQFNLRQETLYMTIWIIDTYLSFHIKEKITIIRNF